MRTDIKISFVLVLIIAYSCSSDSDELKNDALGMESLSGLEFTQSERDSALESLARLKAQYDSLRTIQISNDIPLPLYFNPLINGQKYRWVERSICSKNSQQKDQTTLRTALSIP